PLIELDVEVELAVVVAVEELVADSVWLVCVPLPIVCEVLVVVLWVAPLIVLPLVFVVLLDVVVWVLVVWSVWLSLCCDEVESLRTSSRAVKPPRMALPRRSENTVVSGPLASLWVVWGPLFVSWVRAQVIWPVVV